MSIDTISDQSLVNQTFNDDILLHISGFLTPEGVAKAFVVSKVWKEALSEQIVWQNQYKIQGYALIEVEIAKYLKSDEGEFAPDTLTMIAGYAVDYYKRFQEPIPNVFGPKDYVAYFRDTQVVHPIPRPLCMRKVNNKPDPHDPTKTVGETHVWTYKPRLDIDGKETLLSLNVLKQLIENLRQGHAAKICYLEFGFEEELQMPEGWYLIRKTVFKDEMGLSILDPKKIVKGYQMPTAREVALTALVWRIKTGEFLYCDHHIYTSSEVRAMGCYWAVCQFVPEGLNITQELYIPPGGGGHVGVWKFSYSDLK